MTTALTEVTTTLPEATTTLMEVIITATEVLSLLTERDLGLLLSLARWAELELTVHTTVVVATTVTVATTVVVAGTAIGRDEEDRTAGLSMSGTGDV